MNNNYPYHVFKLAAFCLTSLLFFLSCSIPIVRHYGDLKYYDSVDFVFETIAPGYTTSYFSLGERKKIIFKIRHPPVIVFPAFVGFRSYKINGCSPYEAVNKVLPQADEAVIRISYQLLSKEQFFTETIKMDFTRDKICGKKYNPRHFPIKKILELPQDIKDNKEYNIILEIIKPTQLKKVSARLSFRHFFERDRILDKNSLFREK